MELDCNWNRTGLQLEWSWIVTGTELDYNKFELNRRIKHDIHGFTWISIDL
jgi:hypothetical protein